MFIVYITNKDYIKRRTTYQEDLDNQANLSENFNSEGQGNLKECENGTLTKLTYVEPQIISPRTYEKNTSLASTTKINKNKEKKYMVIITHIV